MLLKSNSLLYLKKNNPVPLSNLNAFLPKNIDAINMHGVGGNLLVFFFWWGGGANLFLVYKHL